MDNKFKLQSDESPPKKEQNGPMALLQSKTILFTHTLLQVLLFYKQYLSLCILQYLHYIGIVSSSPVGDVFILQQVF